MIYRQWCCQKKFKVLENSFLFFPFLIHSSQWWNIFSYTDNEPFRVFKDNYDKGSLSQMCSLEEALYDVLNPILEFKEKEHLGKWSCGIDIICVVLTMGIMSSIIVSNTIFSVSVLLFTIEIILNILLMLALFYFNRLLKEYFIKQLYIAIEDYFLEKNYSKYIKEGKEWFVEKSERNEYTGLIGIRLYNTRILELKYGPFMTL